MKWSAIRKAILCSAINVIKYSSAFNNSPSNVSFFARWYNIWLTFQLSQSLCFYAFNLMIYAIKPATICRKIIQRKLAVDKIRPLSARHHIVAFPFRLPSTCSFGLHGFKRSRPTLDAIAFLKHNWLQQFEEQLLTAGSDRYSVDPCPLQSNNGVYTKLVQLHRVMNFTASCMLQQKLQYVLLSNFLSTKRKCQ